MKNYFKFDDRIMSSEVMPFMMVEQDDHEEMK